MPKCDVNWWGFPFEVFTLGLFDNGGRREQGECVFWLIGGIRILWIPTQLLYIYDNRLFLFMIIDIFVCRLTTFDHHLLLFLLFWYAFFCGLKSSDNFYKFYKSHADGFTMTYGNAWSFEFTLGTSCFLGIFGI